MSEILLLPYGFTAVLGRIDFTGMGGIEVGRRRFQTEADIERAIRDGFGQGTGVDYKPWLRVRDVPSQGLSKKTLGVKVPRPYQLLSQNEHLYFLTLEFSRSVTDIREQYPLLPRSKAEEAAQLLGFTYPRYPGTSLNYVLTTDFLVTTVNASGNQVISARTVKEESAFDGGGAYRVSEKLEIERVFWEAQGVEWKLVLKETLFQTSFARNLAWLRKNAKIDRDLQNYALQKKFIAELQNCVANEWTIEEGLRKVGRKIFVPFPDCKRLYQNLLWNRKILIDLKAELISWSTQLPKFEVDSKLILAADQKIEMTA
ncbi:Tn7 transposase TnsA N-terminal domain-containing protein [Pseudomonas sp. JM0905a]|uniref:TnsA endonuclease N-terminal domain-containing protein n=1 Tax=Pseudomonas sp. JM0905a TaxID=2772484 RepID=UPI0016856824|nr:TnsA endonuclease N-terminal domain-containing protein [Pseudomonas sp. JM0905a]MBD2835537.1 Tn7 transposase TnsA N-terminal domain-containing protein [Pseudomonas sp. JM0905a]